MVDKGPTGELEPQFSSEDATPRAWSEGRQRLEQAEVYWLSTVRPDARTSHRCWLSGWVARCTFARARTSAKPRTSTRTHAASLRPGATPSTRASTWWSRAKP